MREVGWLGMKFELPLTAEQWHLIATDEVRGERCV